MYKQRTYICFSLSLSDVVNLPYIKQRLFSTFANTTAVKYKMSQNIYDTSEFFAGYSQLERSQIGLDGVPEWLRLRTFLPPLQNARALDLGCGMGWYTRWMRTEGGAAFVRGVDLSENMLSRAREMTDKAGIQDGSVVFERWDLDDLEAQRRLLPEKDNGTYDVVFSALALHYLENLPELVRHIHRVLKPGGMFVFSAEHPILTAPSAPGFVEILNPKFNAESASSDAGEEGEKKTRNAWPVDGYFHEGLRVTNWLAPGVRKYHRTATTYVNILLRAGFELTAFDEWCPNEEELEGVLSWVKKFSNTWVRPDFLLMAGRKRVF